VQPDRRGRERAGELRGGERRGGRCRVGAGRRRLSVRGGRARLGGHAQAHEQRGQERRGGVDEVDAAQGLEALGLGGGGGIREGGVEREQRQRGEQRGGQAAAGLERAEGPALPGPAAPLAGRADEGGPEQQDGGDAEAGVHHEEHAQVGERGEHEPADRGEHQREGHERARGPAVGEQAAGEVREHGERAVGGEQSAELGVADAEGGEHGRAEEPRDVERQAEHDLAGDHQGGERGQASRGGRLRDHERRLPRHAAALIPALKDRRLF
jgi:hypothetical protein